MGLGILAAPLCRAELLPEGNAMAPSVASGPPWLGVGFACAAALLAGVAVRLLRRNGVFARGWRGEDRLHKLARQVPGVLFQFLLRRDGSSCFPFASPALGGILRLQPEDIRRDGTALFALIHPDDRERVRQNMLESARLLARWEEEFRICFPDGTVLWLEGQSTPERRADGSVLWSGYFADVTSTRALQERLQESEQRWSFALESSGEGTWAWDLETNRIRSSRWAKELLGYGEDEIGDSPIEWETRVHPEDLPRARAEVERHLAGQSPFYRSEHRLRCKDGSWKWILARGKVVAFRADGRPGLLLGTHADISAHVQARLKAADESAFLQSVFHQASSATFVAALEPDGGFRLVAANSACERLLGIPIASLAGRRIEELATSHPGVLNSLSRQLLACIRSGSPLDYEETISDPPQDTSLWVRLAPVGERTRRIVGTLLDISAWKKNEDRLLEQVRRLESAINSASIGVWELDLPTGVVNWSEGMFELHGLAQGTAITLERWGTCLRGDDGPRFLAELRTVAENRRDFCAHYGLIAGTGETRHLRLTAAVHSDPGRNTLRLRGVAWDVSREECGSAQLRAAAARADELAVRHEAALAAAKTWKEKAAAAQEFHHALLASLQGALRSGLEELAQGGDGAGSAGRGHKPGGARRCAGRLNRTMQAFLDLACLRAERLSLEVQPVGVERLVETTLDTVADRAADKRIELLHTIGGEVPSHIAADGERLRQVLVALLESAIEATPHGEVELSVHCDGEEGSNPIDLYFSVRDTAIERGPGKVTRLQAMEQLERDALAGRLAPAGVHLAVGQQLVRLMGGGLAVTQNPDGGTMVTMRMPVGAIRTASGAPEPGNGRVFEKRHFLVAAVHPGLGALLQRWLVAWGASVASTASASAATSLARGGLVFDAAILDDNLNDVSGLARRIAAPGPAGSLPVLLLQTLPEDAPAATAPGPVFRLAKPVKMAALREALDRALAARGSATDPALKDASEPAAPALPVFDAASIEEMLPDSPARAAVLAARLHQQFFEKDGPLRLAAIRQALHQGDGVRADRELHALQGGLGTLGLLAAAAGGRRLKAAIQAGALERALVELPVLENALTRGQQEMRAWMAARFPEVVI